MSYEKQNFVKGQVLKADHLNHMEAGIVKLEQDISKLPSGFSDNAKSLILNLFEGAAYGNDAMQAKLTALKTEWNADTVEPDTPSDTEDIPGETPVYKLAQATEFTPAKAQCIDTGVKLFESIDPKPAYTVLFEVQYNESLAAKKDTYVLLHCMEESSPWPGFVVQVGSSGVLQCNVYGFQKFLDDRADLIANKRKFAIQFYNSKVKGISFTGNYFTGSKDTGYASDITNYTTAVGKSLILGAYQQSNGTKGRYFDGTIYQCLVYDKALTPAQMLAWINS